MEIIKNIPQNKYNEFIKNMPLVCVDICVVHDKKILMVKRGHEPAKNQYWIVGGRVLKGEKLKDAAYRKAKEEVNLCTTVCNQIHTEETLFNEGPNNIPIHSINNVFYSLATSDNVHLDQNHLDYKWITEIEDDFHPYLKRVLKKVFAIL